MDAKTERVLRTTDEILERIQNLLRRIEWRGGACPDCGALFRHRVHKSDCELASMVGSRREEGHEQA